MFGPGGRRAVPGKPGSWRIWRGAARQGPLHLIHEGGLVVLSPTPALPPGPTRRQKDDKAERPQAAGAWPSAGRLRTNVPCPHGLHSGSLAAMFIGAEIRLEVGFSAAEARLANLAHGGQLRRASESAHNWGADQAQIGPLDAPGMSRLVKVHVRHLVTHEDSAVWALRWEATGATGALLPILDADIVLTQAGEQATVLAVSGAYRPPLGSLGAGAGPGDHASRRRGDDPGLHETDRGGHREPCRRTRDTVYQSGAGDFALARGRHRLDHTFPPPGQATLGWHGMAACRSFP